LPFEILAINLCENSENFSEKKIQKIEKNSEKNLKIEKKIPEKIEKKIGEKILENENLKKVEKISENFATKKIENAENLPEKNLKKVEKTAENGANFDFIFDDEIGKKLAPEKILAEKKIKKVEKIAENSAEKIAEKMREIAEKSGISVFAKNSFLRTKPRIENEKVVFLTNSNFHFEKINSEKIRGAIEGAVRNFADFAVEFRLEKTPDEIATADDFIF